VRFTARFAGPHNKLQAKVLVMKFGQQGELLDLGIRGARVLQEAPPQLKDDLVVNHDDVLYGKSERPRRTFWVVPGPPAIPRSAVAVVQRPQLTLRE